MNGTDLLAEFRENRSEAAFGELVRRYTNLVYSVARRRLGNASQAQEVTQLVFIRLAKAAPKLRGDAELVVWLHRTAVHVSIDLWRSEVRRRAREQHAAAMQPDLHETPTWNELALVLDEAINELNDSDRQAVLLRFFNDKTMRELGAVFGISEDAAKMRVSRALDRLRDQLGARGIPCTSAMVLGTMLAERAVEAAPIQLVATLAAFKFTAPAGLGTAGGIFGLLPHVSKVKLLAGAAAMLSLGTATLLWLRSQDEVPTRNARPAEVSNVAAEQNSLTSASGIQDADRLVEVDREPDPLALLQAVAQARQKIASGSVELQLSNEKFNRERAQVDHITFNTLFAGQKLWFEQVGREYRCTSSGDDEKAKELRRRAESMHNEEAVRAGLLEAFTARYVMVWDGTALMKYSEVDGDPAGTTIDEPGRTAMFTFDPRCLGLRTFLWANSTVENCLGYSAAKSIHLVGQEMVEGVPAWHVRVQTKYDESLDFWIDAARAGRVLKHANGPDVAISKYADASPDNPIPAEVATMEYRNGALLFRKRFVQSKAQFNMPVDPASFTLAGLGMPIGTTVSDVRILRRIGYWTGIGLSENLPNKVETEPETPAPDLAELLALLESDPTTSEALNAAAWILLNTPDGTEVEKAAGAIQQHHVRHPELAYLAQELARVRHRSTTPLLEAILDQNPSPEVQANACFSLATIRKDEAKYGFNQQATAEAEKLFERLIAEFGQIKRRGRDMAELAKPELYELRHLTIGKPAPATAGVDLEGRSMRLSDYRGKIVVLTFWDARGVWRPDAPTLQKLIDRFAGKPVAVLGVYCDDDLDVARTIVEEREITWSSFRDGKSGSISMTWNNGSLPNTWILDGKGRIRERGVHLLGHITRSVDALLSE